MPFFTVSASRVQKQTVNFQVEAPSEKALRDMLDSVDLGEIDHRFDDDGEIDSIEYEVNSIEKSEKPTLSFADEDLQDLLGFS
jgi:hypothetical protein